MLKKFFLIFGLTFSAYLFCSTKSVTPIELKARYENISAQYNPAAIAQIHIEIILTSQFESSALRSRHKSLEIVQRLSNELKINIDEELKALAEHDSIVQDLDQEAIKCEYCRYSAFLPSASRIPCQTLQELMSKMKVKFNK